MAFLRLAAISFALILLLILATPLQWAASRLGWPLRHRIPIAACRGLAAILRLKVRAHGGAVPARARLLAANHVSWLDILALCSLEPICFLAKAEVASWPVIAFFVRVQETVLVDRNRRRTIPGANATMAQRMLAGRAMLLFPEGTTGDGLKLRKFRSSHFASARDLLARAKDVETVAVQPVAIKYSSPQAAWFGDATLLPHLWALLKGKPISCEVMFGEPLIYRRDTDRKQMTREVAARIATMLDRLPPLHGAIREVEAPDEQAAGTLAPAS
jgi:1-acyl-sn-glycerol-3-phosphate acyltransferase